MAGTVLLTNLYVSQYTGSELQTLQAAKWFLENGWEVEVATLEKSAPLLKYFEDNHIKVTLILTEELSRKTYDLLWGHHWPVLNYIIFHRMASFKKAVHFCLGALEPLEAALPFHELVPLYFTNSEETRRYISDMDGVDLRKIHVSPNAADEIFFEMYKAPLQKPLKKIAVISNHITGEVSQLHESLASWGIDVDYIGFEKKSILVDVALLKGYDLIITIGRTVQQCFACGVPVYCYDIYGGPGYINEANIADAERFNFSGRNFNRILTPGQLAEDIRLNYADSREHIAYLHDIAQKRYRFKANMVKNMQLVDLSPEFDSAAVLERYRQCARPNDAFLRSWRTIPELQNMIAHLQEENKAVNAMYEDEKEQLEILTKDFQKTCGDMDRLTLKAEAVDLENAGLKDEIQHVTLENHHLRKSITEIIESRSYRLARRFSKIYQRMRKLLS